MKLGVLSALGAAAALAVSSPAAAFCRATTCDPGTDQCARDTQTCLTTGKPLFWASSCVQVYVQANGAPTQGITFDAAKQSATRAFDAWLAADCGGGAPLIDVQVMGPITCGASEYNQQQKNANIVVFREDEWPYADVGAADTFGLTVVRFDPKSGEIWDADIELNAVTENFSVGDPVSGADLDSVLTHEAGHLLGLAHSPVQDATMFQSYVTGTDSLRSLATDDVQAICTTYPSSRVPNRASCSPRHGFSDLCGAQQPPNSATDEGTDAGGGSEPSDATTSKGCAFASSSTRWELPWVVALLGGIITVHLRRRSARHQFVSCGRSARQR